MKKQLKIVISFFALAVLLASCRAGDCGCPMSMKNEGEEDSIGVVQINSDASQPSSAESHLRYHRRSDTW